MANLIGQGPSALPGPTSIFYSTPYPLSPGARARDNEGNEYLFVDFTATVYAGCLVQIDELNQAAPLLGTALYAYRVGVVMGGTPSSITGNHPTSDSAGWVQIYGVHPAVQTGTATNGGVSDSSVAYFCIPQTSVGTPSGTLSVIAQGAGTSIAQSTVDGNKIHGMWLVNFNTVSSLTTWSGSSGASGPTSILPDGTTGISTGTSAFIGQTYAVYMNYPWVEGITIPLGAATSDV